MSEGPLWLLIVLISPLDSPLIAPLCLQGHHYSDQAQLCFSLLFMNIILPNDCFEVFLAPGITFDHLPLCKFTSALGGEQDTISFTRARGPFKSPTNLKSPKHFLKCFSLPSPSPVYSFFGVLAARGQRCKRSLCIRGGRSQKKSSPLRLFASLDVSFSGRDACFRCIALMRRSGASVCCHLRKSRRIYCCVSRWGESGGDEREKVAGHRLRSSSVLCSAATLTGARGGEKKSRRLFCLEGRRAMK